MTLVRISVVLATRHRPDQAGPCVASILANPGDHFELIVVDQSDDDATERALAAYAADQRLRYVRSQTRGLSVSRNVGIEAARAPIIAFTDDDCRVSEDWIARIEAAFAASPEAAIVFGKVSLPAGALDRGYGAEFEPHRREYQHCFPPADVAWGIGANMAIRRRALGQIGSFDPLLGTGSDFGGGEDTDLAIRAIAAGLKIVNAKEVSVLHLGLREGADATKLVRGYGEGVGATLAKHVRLGTRNGGRLLASWVALHARRGLHNAVRFKRPTGLGFVGGMLLGICRSFAYGVDRDRRIYVASSRK